MSLKVPQGAAIILLDLLIASWGTLTLRLFSNNYTPTDTDTRSNYTEASFTGYSAYNISAFAASATVGGRATTTGTLHTFTATAGGGGNVYGYYVENATPALLWAERDASAPIDMNSNGKTYTVTVVFTGKSEF